MDLNLKKVSGKGVIVKVDIKSGKVIINNLKETWDKMDMMSLASNIVYFPDKNSRTKNDARVNYPRLKSWACDDGSNVRVD